MSNERQRMNVGRRRENEIERKGQIDALENTQV